MRKILLSAVALAGLTMIGTSHNAAHAAVVNPAPTAGQTALAATHIETVQYWRHHHRRHHRRYRHGHWE